MKEGENMGTNFRFQPSSFGALSEFPSIHIGKRSGGWVFSFQSFDAAEEASLRGVGGKLSDKVASLKVRSWKDWQALLREFKGTIKDEYGATYTVDQFVEVVREVSPGMVWGPTGRPLKCQYKELQRGGSGSLVGDLDWLDDEGFSFTSRSFS